VTDDPRGSLDLAGLGVERLERAIHDTGKHEMRIAYRVRPTNVAEYRAYLCDLDMAHRDCTGWLGMSDSNSGIRGRAMYLRYRDNSCWLGPKIGRTTLTRRDWML
jgi:hypothetical protein